MATLRALMALYGALDPAESPSEDPAVVENAARFLPTTEGRGGWFQSIVDLCAPPSEERFPDVDGALDELLQGPEDGDSTITVPERARLAYVIGALSHHPDYAHQTIEREGLSARTLALAGPEYRSTDVEVGYELLQHLYTNFDSFQDWGHVVRVAVEQGLLLAEIADVAPCWASIQTVNGYRCVVIDTVSKRHDVLLANVKDVIDPLNWKRNSPNLFCDMEKQDPYERDYWNRVLETVSLGCNLGFDRLVTPLKYFNSEPHPTKAFVEYKLDTGPKDGDGRVKVDQGFIKMTALKPGVRIRTKKIVHIAPLSPDAQAVFVCGSGYAAMSDEMMFGSAYRPPDDTVKWRPSKFPPRPGTSESSEYSTDAPQPAPSQPGVVSITVDLWEKCVKELSAKNLEVSSKWLNNKLTANDLISYSQFVGGDLASAPWRYFKALSQVPLSGTPPDNDTNTGGGT